MTITTAREAVLATRRAAQAARREAVARMAADGARRIDIAKTLGVSPDTIRIDLKELGIQARQEARQDAAVTARRSEVARMITDGISSDQIAAHFGVHPAAISRDLHALGISPRTIAAAARRAQIPALHAEGLSVQTIADRLGCSRETINRDLHALNLPRPHAGPLPVAELLAEYAWLTDGGVPPETAAHRLGVELSTIRKHQSARGAAA